MAWSVLIFLFAGLLIAAAIWGKWSDPKKGGAYGCCHCGQCIAAGECVLRKQTLQKTAKKEQDVT